MGRGSGGGQGRGQGPLRPSGTRQAGRMGGPEAAGPGGYCVCPACGHKVPHQAGQPCSSIKCPKCGVTMVRE
jgi:hypothetical protein